MASPRTHRVTEAWRTREADRTFNETQELVCDALEQKTGATGGMGSPYLWIRDIADTWVVYELEGGDDDASYRIEYTIADDGTVTFTSDPVKVETQTTYTTVTEATQLDRIGGRVLEAKGSTADGGRVFGVQIIAVGTSKNGVRYPESVLRAAAPKYEGAKAFDHHRTDTELRTSSIAGLVGHYRNVEATSNGVFGDLHLLPSATHTIEALEASLAAQDAGLPPVVGISHDVQLTERPVIDAGRRIREAVSIEAVLSADVVADPSAGGRVTRVVAGGIGSDPNPPSQEDNPMTLKELLDLLRKATPEKRAELLQEHGSVLTGAGFSESDVPTLLGEEPPATSTEAPTETTTETETEPELVGARESLAVRALVREALRDANLSDRLLEGVVELLPARVAEADVTSAVRALSRTLESVDRDNIRPKVEHVEVGSEDHDAKVRRLEATFKGDWQNGYTRLSEAYTDITGQPYRPMDVDFASAIIRESWGGRFADGRQTESLTSSSWGEVLADVMNRRIVELYQGSKWSEWRKISTVVPVTDFRSQKLIQVGEYSSLPTVNEGAPYQGLTSPSDVQEAYTPTKKGGTEDYTYEAAKNDDLRALVAIPTRLARLAAWTVYKAVFDIFTDNSALDADSVALFHATHSNTTAVALGQSGLSQIRYNMRTQTAYGDTTRALGLLPKFLIVPNELEEIAYQLSSSAVAIPSTPAGAADTPNLHKGIEPIVVDYYTDANDWYATCDPADHPLIEVGFMDGKVDPELFMQDDPTVGSVFSADKVTWKLRHIYGLTAVDYRGFQRGTQ
jgi:hypothetical protein